MLMLALGDVKAFTQCCGSILLPELLLDRPDGDCYIHRLSFFHPCSGNSCIRTATCNLVFSYQRVVRCMNVFCPLVARQLLPEILGQGAFRRERPRHGIIVLGDEEDSGV